MKSRGRALAPIVLPFWIQEGRLLHAKREDLEAAIQASGRSEAEIKKLLGATSHLLDDALQGKKLDGWDANHLEGALMTEQARREAFADFYRNPRIRRI